MHIFLRRIFIIHYKIAFFMKSNYWNLPFTVQCLFSFDPFQVFEVSFLSLISKFRVLLHLLCFSGLSQKMPGLLHQSGMRTQDHERQVVGSLWVALSFCFHSNFHIVSNNFTEPHDAHPSSDGATRSYLFVS